jgi:AcrR family transcriptional regulator
MASQVDPGTAPRVPLSRERVLRAAVKRADAGGIESLSMRKLAQQLGVEAMSLYYHVANKDDLLAGMVDLVVREMALPSEGTDWKAALRQTAISAHDTFVRHRWACSLMMSVRDGTARLRWMDAVLRCLREAGFSAELAHHAYHALDSHIMGFTLWQLSFPFAAEQLADVAAAFLRELPIDEYPYLAEHVEWHLTASTDDDEGEFAFGLDLILDGLERIRDMA